VTAAGFLVVTLRVTSVAGATWSVSRIAYHAFLATSSWMFAPSAFYGAPDLSRWDSFVASSLGEVVALVVSLAAFAASGWLGRRTFPSSAPLSRARGMRSIALLWGVGALTEASRRAVLLAVYGGSPATRPPTVHPILFDPYATSLFHVVGFACIAIVALAGPSRVSGFVRRRFLASRADATGG
jgi:hypothetical protein